MFQQNKGKRRTSLPFPALVKVTYQVKGGGHRFLSAPLPSVIRVNFIITWPPSLAGVTAMLTSTETLLIGHHYQIITSLHYQGICQTLWSVSFRDYVPPPSLFRVFASLASLSAPSVAGYKAHWVVQVTHYKHNMQTVPLTSPDMGHKGLNSPSIKQHCNQSDYLKKQGKNAHIDLVTHLHLGLF